MNKKHLKVALLSLMCTSMALSYTACKDYDDDISNLQSQIDANKDAISSINSQIANGAILSSVTKTADGKGIVVTVKKGDTTEEFTIKNGENGTNGTDAVIWTIGTDGYWYKDGVKTEYKAIGTDGTNGTNGENGTNGTNGTDGLNAPYYVANPTTGMLEHYVWKDGKAVRDEAGDVRYTNPATEASSNITATDDGINLVITGMVGKDGKPLGAISIAKSGALRSLVFQPNLYLDGVEATRYAYAPNVVVLTSDAAAAKTGSSYLNGSEFTIKGTAGYKASSKSVNIPSLSFVDYALNPSNAKVTDFTFAMTGDQKEAVSRATAPKFEIQDEPTTKDGILTLGYKVTNPDVISADKELLTIFAAEAAGLKGDKETITSDFGALLPEKVAFKALAFTKESNKTTTAADTKDLYTTGKKALESAPSILVNWDYTAKNDGKGYNLKEKICVHYAKKDFVLPDASAAHEVMTLADAEKYYSLTTVFTNVAYNVGGNDTDENQYAIVSADGIFTPAYVNAQGNTVANNDQNGKSSIGRRPLVLVTLVNTQGEVVLNGYVAFEITKQVVTPEGVVIEPELLTSKTFDYNCSFNLKSTWAQWSGMVLEDDEIMKSNEEFHAEFTWTSGKTYTKTTNSEGKSVYTEVTGNKFGTITVEDDAQTGEVNSVLNWTGDYAAVQAVYAQPNHTVTLYVQYATSTNPASYVYVGMTVTIKNEAQANWSTADNNKLVPEWHNGQIWIHVAAPEVGNDVEEFEYSLPNAWLNGEIGVTGNTNYNTNVKYTFRWSATQAADYTVTGSTLKYKGNAIATLTVDGKIVYLDNDNAKELLNSGEMVPSGNVQIVATYGTCNIAFPNTYDFTVKFLRPLTMTEGNNPEFVPATAGGSKAPLASLFNLVDWRKKAVTEYDEDTQEMSAVKDNDIDLYTFYGVAKLTVDKTKIMFKNGSKWEPITANKNDNLDIIGTPVSVDATGNIVTIDITNVDNINAVELIYTSASQGVTSQYDLKIPVTLEYSWGKLNAEMPAIVKVTMGQD